MLLSLVNQKRCVLVLWMFKIITFTVYLGFFVNFWTIALNSGKGYTYCLHYEDKVFHL